jgi:hypothetical protein
MRLSRGAERLLDLLRWYGARFRRIFTKQSKLAAHLKVCVQQIRRYLVELRGLVTVYKCGRNPAEYVLSQDSVDQYDASENARLTRGRCAVDARSIASASLLLSVAVSQSRSVPRKPPRRQTALERASERFLREG